MIDQPCLMLYIDEPGVAAGLLGAGRRGSGRIGQSDQTARDRRQNQVGAQLHAQPAVRGK